MVKGGFIPGIQGWLIYKNQSILYTTLTERKKKKHMITSTDAVKE